MPRPARSGGGFYATARAAARIIVNSSEELAAAVAIATSGEIFVSAFGNPYALALSNVAFEREVTIRSLSMNAPARFNNIDLTSVENLTLHGIANVTGGDSLKSIDVAGTIAGLRFLHCDFTGGATGYDTGPEPNGLKGIEISGIITGEAGVEIGWCKFRGNEQPIYVDATGTKVWVHHVDIAENTKDGINCYTNGTLDTFIIEDSYIHNAYGAAWAVNHGDFIQLGIAGMVLNNAIIRRNILDSNGGAAGQMAFLGMDGSIGYLEFEDNVGRNASYAGCAYGNITGSASIRRNWLMFDSRATNTGNTGTFGYPAFWTTTGTTKTNVVIEDNLEGIPWWHTAGVTKQNNRQLHRLYPYGENALQRWMPNPDAAMSWDDWKAMRLPANENCGPAWMKVDPDFALPAPVDDPGAVINLDPTCSDASKWSISHPARLNIAGGVMDAVGGNSNFAGIAVKEAFPSNGDYWLRFKVTAYTSGQFVLRSAASTSSSDITSSTNITIDDVFTSNWAFNAEGEYAVKLNSMVAGRYLANRLAASATAWDHETDDYYLTAA